MSPTTINRGTLTPRQALRERDYGPLGALALFRSRIRVGFRRVIFDFFIFFGSTSLDVGVPMRVIVRRNMPGKGSVSKLVTGGERQRIDMPELLFPFVLIATFSEDFTTEE